VTSIPPSFNINTASAKKSQQKQRWIVLIHYGGNPPKCACCGESNYEFLTMDHINGGGIKHRIEISNGKGASYLQFQGRRYNPRAFYKWLIDNNFPEGFRVLCMNCNHSYGHYGHCPHSSGHSKFQIPSNLNIELKPTRNGIIRFTTQKPLPSCKQCRKEYENNGTHPNFAGFCSTKCHELWKSNQRRFRTLSV
jgi:hypothetical protein